MSTLRLPLIGDFVYVSRLETSEIERKFTVTGEAEDGYYIVPEGMEPVNNTSMIRYRFLSKKWVVEKAEDIFNVRIQLNPELYDLQHLGVSNPGGRIFPYLSGENFDAVGDIIDEFRSIFNLYLSTSFYDIEVEGDGSLYLHIMKVPNRINIFEWLKRNYVVDYPKYLIEAIGNAMNDPDERLDLFEWLLNQDIDWTKYRDRDNLDLVHNLISEVVIGTDRADIFRLLIMMPALIAVTEKNSGISYMKSAEDQGATKILELLRTVPTKPVQVKHL